LEKGCKCNHAELTEFMNTDAFDENDQLIFNHPKITEKAMSNILLKAVRKIFRKKAPYRIVGKKGYRKSEEPCLFHKI